jgi:hypothetical protein
MITIEATKMEFDGVKNDLFKIAEELDQKDSIIERVLSCNNCGEIEEKIRNNYPEHEFKCVPNTYVDEIEEISEHVAFPFGVSNEMGIFIGWRAFTNFDELVVEINIDHTDEIKKLRATKRLIQVCKDIRMNFEFHVDGDIHGTSSEGLELLKMLI